MRIGWDGIRDLLDAYLQRKHNSADGPRRPPLDLDGGLSAAEPLTTTHKPAKRPYRLSAKGRRKKLAVLKRLEESNPEFFAKRNAAASKTFERLQSDPDFTKKRDANLAQQNAEPNFIAKRNAAARECMIRQSNRPKFRKKARYRLATVLVQTVERLAAPTARSSYEPTGCRARPSFGPRSRELSLKARYHLTHSMMISWSKCRPLKRSCAEVGSVIPAVIAGYRYVPDFEKRWQTYARPVGDSANVTDHDGDRAAIKGYLRETC